jgi:hypothetical protein
VLRAAKQEPASQTTQVVTDEAPQIPSSDWQPVEVAVTNGRPSLAAPISSSQGQPALPVDSRPADNRWYTVVGLSALAALICSVDRAAISVAILPMSEQFHWSDSTKGAVNRWACCLVNDLVSVWYHCGMLHKMLDFSLCRAVGSVLYKCLQAGFGFTAVTIKRVAASNL